MLSFTLPKGQRTEKGRAKAKHSWVDPNHPNLDGATDIVTSLIQQTGLTGGRVLLLGDSTSTHCIDRQSGWEYGRYIYNWSARDSMQERVLLATGVEVHHYGVSGTSFEGDDNFGSWLDRAVQTNAYDAILLVGGWNQKAGGARSKQGVVDYLQPILQDFTERCKVALASRP